MLAAASTTTIMAIVGTIAMAAAAATTTTRGKLFLSPGREDSNLEAKMWWCIEILVKNLPLYE